jgi:hypothetical protein
MNKTIIQPRYYLFNNDEDKVLAIKAYCLDEARDHLASVDTDYFGYHFYADIPASEITSPSFRHLDILNEDD